MPGANQKSNIRIFIMRTKNNHLYCCAKILIQITYLVTFKLSGTQFWCNRKSKLNGKILNTDTKKQQLHIAVYIYI